MRETLRRIKDNPDYSYTIIQLTLEENEFWLKVLQAKREHWVVAELSETSEKYSLTPEGEEHLRMLESQDHEP